MLIEAGTPSFQRVRMPHQGGSMPLEIGPKVERPTVITPAESDSMPLEFRLEAEQLTLGRQLFLLRRTAGLFQKDLASVTGIDRSSISKLENGIIRDPNVSVVASLVEALGLEPDSLQKLLLIASLAKDRDKAYINGLLGLSGSDSDSWRPYVLNNGISKAVKPVDKVKNYKERRNKRSQKGIAKIGGIDHSFVSRFLSGKITDISGSSFIAIIRGLNLTTKEQVQDLFDSFGDQRRINDVMEALEQEAS